MLLLGATRTFCDWNGPNPRVPSHRQTNLQTSRIRAPETRAFSVPYLSPLERSFGEKRRQRTVRQGKSGRAQYGSHEQKPAIWPHFSAGSVQERLRFLAIWRRERDSNPRYGFPYTHFPGVRLQPLGHPSGAACGRGAAGQPDRAVGTGAVAAQYSRDRHKRKHALGLSSIKSCQAGQMGCRVAGTPGLSLH
jgi:hypothetical protein